MRRLFVLRPEPGASATVQDALGLGLDAVAMPLFAIEPLTWEAPDPRGFDGLLLTSANAVRSGGEELNKVRGLPVHAVGQATAKAAQEAKFALTTIGTSGIDLLLRSIDPRLRLLHLCGEHRTQAEALQTITAIPVYRSAALAVPSGFERIAGQTVALHSRRTAQRFRELVDQEGLDRSRIRVAAISEPVRGAVGEGWELSKAVERPDSATLLALAASLCDKPVPK